MATFTDNYIIVGADTDNFDCDDTGGWEIGGNAEDPTTQDEKVQGDYSLGLTTSDKDESWWYHDISEDYRFKITENDLGLWFFYSKGKGDNVLVQDNSAIVVRLYFGGTDKYADYCLTENGDLDLDFGWQMLMCSGTNLNGGSVGGGHDGDSDFYLDVYRFEFRINCANAADVPLGLDAIFIGSEIQLTDGDATLYDLYDYTNNTRDNFPLGTIKYINHLVEINSKLTINGGNLSDINKYIYFNQLSNEVSHELNIIDGNVTFGELDDYNNTYNGCYLSKNNIYRSDLNVTDTGSLHLYNSIIENWLTINLSTSIIVIQSMFNSNDVIIINDDSITFDSVVIHDATNDISDYALEVYITDADLKNIKIYKNSNGIRFLETITCTNILLSNNDNYDITIKDDKDINLISSQYTTLQREE